MASPAETRPVPHPAAAEFDPLEFWILHRKRILLYLGIIAVALVIYFAYWVVQQNTRQNSQRAFAQATTAEDYRKVAESYPGTIVAGNALLILADKLREEGKLADSDAALHKLIDKQPKHPLIPGAYTSLATNLEAEGKLDEALTACKKVATSYPNSFAAPAAYLSQARLLKAQGKTEEAKHAYETIIGQFPESMFRLEAMNELQKAKK